MSTVWDECAVPRDAVPDGDVGGSIPEAVLLAAHPSPAGGGRVHLELDPGTASVLAFTSVDQLTACLGLYQPWVAVTRERLRQLVGGGSLVLDPSPGIVPARWSKRAVDELAEMLP